MEYHLKYYLKNENLNASLKNGKIYQVSENNYKLTIEEKRKILLNNIYGVDIDSQAVEVTKLSLLLKLMENENQESVGALFKYSDLKVLPDLSNNIKCGNSLIGTDFYAGQDMGLFEDKDMKKVNAFDWDKEFPEIFKNGGFDVVIGNPPWGAELEENIVKYLVTNYKHLKIKNKDSYFYFILKSYNLSKINSILGFIIPNTWLLINNAENFRDFILKNNIHNIIDIGDGVFVDAIVESSILILEKDEKEQQNCLVRRYKKGILVLENTVDKSVWVSDNYKRINLENNNEFLSILNRVRMCSELFGKNCEIIFGIKPYQMGYGIPPQTREMLEKRIYHSVKIKGEQWKPLLTGTNINRYYIDYKNDQYIKYGKWLMYPSNENKILGSKILLRRTSDNIKASLDTKKFYPQNSIFIITSTRFELKYLVGLLNSKLFDYLYRHICPQKGKIFAEIKPSVIKDLPICNIGNHNDLILLIDQMFETQKEYHSTKKENEKEQLKKKIDIIDNQIDKLVYKLYGLTEEEIKIVEESTK
jgi:hypothetical protein